MKLRSALLASTYADLLNRCLLSLIVGVGLFPVLFKQVRCQDRLLESRAPKSDRIHQEFRIVWGGQTGRTYQGTVTIDQGRLAIVRNLSVQPEAVGSVKQQDDRTIEIAGAADTTFGGLDLRVDGTDASLLKISLHDSTSSTFEKEIAVRDLQQDLWIQSSSDQGFRVAIERQLHDKLRVTDNRSHAVFDCGDTWEMQVAGDRTGLPSGDYQLMASWVDIHENGPVVDIPVKVDASGSFSPVEISVLIPDSEGPHRLEFTLTRPSIMRGWANQHRPLLRRSVEIAAFSDQRLIWQVNGWKQLRTVDTVEAIQAENPHWLVSSVSNKTPVESINRVSVREILESSRSKDSSKAERCVVIEPGGWLSLSLSELQPGHPHRLRIQVPTDSSSHLAVAIQDSENLDQNAICPQHTIVVGKATNGHHEKWIQSDILFWPRTGSIQLVLASGHRFRSASLGQLSLEAAELGVSANDVPREQNPDGGEHQQRSVAVYIDQPFIADCLAAPRERDSKTDKSLETWGTWQSVAERLVTHLQLSGANTLVLLAAGEGGCLFPMKSLQTVPWIDKSTFFTDGRSPAPHDFIKLLLRHLDRSGMRLVIELDLDSNTPLIRKRNDPQQDLFQEPLQVQEPFDGRSMAESFESENKRPNPLHPSVQATVSEIIQEIVLRYRDDPAFDGISLRLHDNSLTVFGGQQTGYNASLLEQYAIEKSIQLPGDQQRLENLLSGVAKYDYLSWRANHLTDFYKKQLRLIRQQSSKLNFYVNTIRLAQSINKSIQLGGLEGIKLEPSQELLGCGIDLAGLKTIDGLFIVQGTVRNGWASQSSRNWIETVATEDDSDSSLVAQQAVLISHQPRSVSLRREEQKIDANHSPDIQSSRDSSFRSAQLQSTTPPLPRVFVDSTPVGNIARQALLDHLLRTDVQMLGFGGWQPVWTMEPAVMELISVFKQLPPVKFKDIAVNPSDAPVRVRSGSYEGSEYLQLFNSSSIDCELKLTWNPNVEPTLKPITPVQDDAVTEARGIVNVKLAAGQLIAWKWNVKPSEIDSIELSTSSLTLRDIAQQIEQLESSLSMASDSISQRVLFHGSGTFEQWPGSSRPIGWNVSSLPNTTIEKATELPHSGNSCLRMTNGNPQPVAVWIQSNSIELPKTGRLALRAWLRASAAEMKQPVVKLGVIGRLKNGQRYERSVFYGGDQELGEAREIANDWGRRPAELQLSDIPIDDLVELKIAIDLIGEGKIWVDDVEVVETWLHPDERNYLRGQLLVAKQKMDDNNPFLAERLLRSQWNSYLNDLEAESARRHEPAGIPAVSSQEAGTTWNQPKSTFQQWREALLDRWRR